MYKRQVQYRTIKSLREQPPAEADLPFLKRHAFRDEKEFRLFVCQMCIRDRYQAGSAQRSRHATCQACSMSNDAGSEIAPWPPWP